SRISIVSKGGPPMRRASVFVVVGVLVLVAFAVGPLRRTAPSAPTRADASGEQARAEGPGNPDAQEQADMTAEHLEAAGEAKSNGTFGVTKPVPHLAAAGWAGESVFHPNADDWEPAAPAD